MKKYFFFLCLYFGIIQFTNCQIYFTATYDIRLAEDELNYPGVLEFNDSVSVFQYQNYNEEVWKRDEGIDEEGNGRNQKIYTDSIGRYFINNGEKLICREFCGKKPFTYEDKINIKWKYQKGEKLIGSLKCNKAIANFRGRNYTAWYSTDLPFSFGPWKFSGLPGLIIELIDKENRVYITLKDIEEKDDSVLKVKSLNENQISKGEFRDCKLDNWQKESEKMKANFAKIQARHPNLEMSLSFDQESAMTEINEN